MGKTDNNIPGAPLTPREKQVADEVMEGHTNREIAKTFGLSYETVKEHVQHILAKFDVDRRELIAIRLMKEKLTGEVLGKDFVKRFDQMAAAAEQTADELKRQVESMRALVGTAIRRLKKGKRQSRTR
jgi:DNA-binding CsgD family transcriptional regulator